MVIILSPAKTLNFKNDSPTQRFSRPVFLEEASQLVELLQKFSPANLRDLMKINNGLGELNYMRYQKWETQHTSENSLQAVFAFEGTVYNGLDAYSLTTGSLAFAQNHLRILSGLYGCLNPLDLVQPYRLEMGTTLSFDNYKNLYSYWAMKINTVLNSMLEKQKSKTLINLASNEYAKAAHLNKVRGKVITPVFKELKANEYKIITVYAKKARGLMTRFILENKIENPEELKLFDLDGYGFSESLSNENIWMFTRQGMSMCK